MRIPVLTLLVLLVSAAGVERATAYAPRDGELAIRLQALREEEKLARDVYRTLHKKWGDQVFANISRSEQDHMEAVRGLLGKYGVADPIAEDIPGRFPTPAFQKMYDRLTQQGLSSPLAAIQVGLLIEEMDIVDLREFRREVSQPDVERVLTNLERGSRNHLRAFANRLNRLGGTYVPTHLDGNEFAQIAGSSTERGGPQGGQRGAGRNGRGNGKGGGRRGGPGKSGGGN